MRRINKRNTERGRKMITREEYELLKHYRATGYDWIARDKNYDLYAFKTMPTKFISFWAVESGFSLPCLIGDCGNNILTCVTWEDEKATNILDLIQDYEAHQVITGGTNGNKAELVKEIESVFDKVGIHSYRAYESCMSRNDWVIGSDTVRDIFSVIDKHVADSEKVVIPSFVA